MPSTPLADLLGQHLQRAHTSVNRLAKLSGIPQRTIANWLNGFIQKPHQWQSLVRVALVLHLDLTQTNELLQVAGHPSLSELRVKVSTQSDNDLLSSFLPSTPRQSPFQAIADLPTFVGRTSELEDLKHALLDGGRAAICGLHGMGGVGKTSLAAHLAYQLRGEFPDGVLWARLDTSDSLSILGVFADAYGKDVSQYKDVESRASVVRDLLASKRALIILDNAETSAQVRPMLPPSTGNSAVLITTRHDLSALDGWTRLTLEPFDTESEEVLQLFENYLEQDFVRLHRATLLEIAALLGHLPLALAITAGRLANDSSRSLGKLNHKTSVIKTMLDSLRASHTRLDTLTRDDLGVRASFDVSYAALSPRQQELFATLGVFSGEDFGSDAVAYLTDQTPDQADTALKHLQSLSLVQESRAARWRLHPLLLDYAREKLEVIDRLISVVEKTLLMYRQAVQGQWAFIQSLDVEIPNIRFALDQAYRLKLYQPLLETVRAIFPILSVGAWFSLARAVLEQGREAAQMLGDLDANLYFIKGLAYMQMGLGDNKNGRENLHLALQLAQTANRAEEVAEIYMNMGRLEIDMGYQKQAKIYFEESLALAKKIDAQPIVGMVINNIGLILVREARYVEAEAMFLESLEIVRAYKNNSAMIIAFMNLGDVSSLQDDWERADTYWQEGLSLAHKINDRASTVVLLANIALVHAQRGEWVEADQSFEEAIQLAQQINSPRMESAARSEFGNILRKQGRLDTALEQLNRARELADEAGDMERKGITLYYLGLLYLDLMQLEEACIALNEALSTAKEINHEIMIADIYFVQAKVALANGGGAKAEQWAGESLAIYERLGLTRQSEKVRRWLETP
jgi:tetratricopeptide (TPR) repeat protein